MEKEFKFIKEDIKYFLSLSKDSKENKEMVKYYWVRLNVIRNFMVKEKSHLTEEVEHFISEIRDDVQRFLNW